jgi:hypothetical protein
MNFAPPGIRLRIPGGGEVQGWFKLIASCEEKQTPHPAGLAPVLR